MLRKSTIILIGLSLLALVGCSDKKELPEANQPLSQPSNSDQTTPEKNENASSFQEHLKVIEKSDEIKDIEFSEETERYVYIKETDKDKFEVYYGDYKQNSEKLVIKHSYNYSDSTVSISPKGDYFLVTRLKEKNPDRYNSELYYTKDLKTYFTLFSIGLPIWDSNGKLIRSTEYVDKYPTSYQSLISVDTFKTEPEDNNAIEQTVDIVEGDKYEENKVIFNIASVENNVVSYEEIDINTQEKQKRTINY